MNIIDAIKQRHSARAFMDKAVATETIELILDAARCAPSGGNTQPWQVAVVYGETKRQLQQALEHAFRGGVPSDADYRYYPVEWREPYKDRRRACALQLYEAMAVTMEDREKRADLWAANFRAFDAPVMLLFFMDAVMQTGSFMDYGMFMQNLMLAAMEYGLATCPQASLAEYPSIVKQALDYPADSILLGGMALGYENSGARINGYRTPRQAVADFARYFK
jgi:nitroreductase